MIRTLLVVVGGRGHRVISVLTCWILFFEPFVHASPPHHPLSFMHAVVITEIMADPSPAVGLPGVEWIELHNRSAAPVSLQGWRISDASGTSGPMPAVVLQPDSVVLVCSAGSLAAMQVYGRALSVTSFPSLDNAADALVLRSSTGQVIHAVRYFDRWHSNTLKRDGGWSLEMQDVQVPCVESGNWTSSVDPRGGTPGMRNSASLLTAGVFIPKVQRITAPMGQRLLLWCTGWVDSTLVLSPSLYQVEDRTVTGVRVLAPFYDQIELMLSEPLDSGRVYQVRVEGLAGCTGIRGEPASFPTAMASAPQRDQVRIHELLFNPPRGGADYVELALQPGRPIDLSLLYITNRDSRGALGTPIRLQAAPTLFFPGQLLVLCSDTSWLMRQYPPPDSSALVIPVELPSFNDDAGSVVLLNDQGVVLDELSYADDWHYVLLRNTEGVALERIDLLAATQQAANWHSAAAPFYGTPGRRNSQSRLTETNTRWVWLSQDVLSYGLVGSYDFVLIHYALPQAGYTGRVAFYDLQGRLIHWIVPQALCGTKGFFRWDGLITNRQRVPAGSYVLWVEFVSPTGDIRRKKMWIAVAPG
jgi:hypothetical protein